MSAMKDLTQQIYLDFLEIYNDPFSMQKLSKKYGFTEEQISNSITEMEHYLDREAEQS
jgi:transcriptional antiterminator